RAGFSDYRHTEYEGADIGTIFINQGIESRAELVQANRGGWTGASGVQYFYRDFNAIGDEAFVPQNDTEQFAVFTLQEWHVGPFSIEGSARYESTSIIARAQNVARRFNAVSGAVGVSMDVGATSKVGVNVARTARAPSAEELLSDGPHVATASYERGSADFTTERAWSVEAFAKLRAHGATINLSAFSSWFDNFIYAADTGLIADDLPLFQYTQAKARYYGAEIELSAPIAQFGGYSLAVDGTGDVVRARLAGGGNVPRIPPLRLRGGLDLSGTAISLRGEVEWSAAQNRTATYESATGAFTTINASAQWKAAHGVTLILSADNLLDVVGRRHASYTKDFVPLTGRDIRATVRLSF
ncbi:MAG: TonB-dependent receptor, partial [Sphingopyxis sp.]